VKYDIRLKYCLSEVKDPSSMEYYQIVLDKLRLL